MGGRDDHKPISSVHVYDCYKKTWSKVSDMRKSRESPAVAVSTFAKEQTGTFCTWCSLGVGAGTSVESCEFCVCTFRLILLFPL